MSSEPFALTVRASRNEGYEIAEMLGFDEVTEALAVSIFDDGPDHVCVQAIYEKETLAEAAKITLPSELDAIVTRLPDEDWVGLSQSGLPPIHAGRFVVHGSHDVAPDGSQLSILLDAGQAFGTGHHGTTKGCLLIIDQLESDGFNPDTILDLGTGAGILAIGAAKLFPSARLLATDIDPVAVQVAADNAELNDVGFETMTANGFDHTALSGKTFDLVIANILAGPLRELAPNIAAAINPKGRAILSGILDEQAEWVAEAFRAQGLTIALHPSLDGWTSVTAARLS